ncbi:MAG TPA: Mpo1-like protein [Sphingomonas sp.]|uniref:Mpo1 family 2-hydroxy fatty acid dioxygenase n=1 Tax=Sphingomonas sp. TaxID=28214 RepID=UPI002C3959AB|nr:Mpo1-like protein [Sphingomonas sp.]HMI18617.1 Mpo1-like protein [Sphingomonas sp.]
MKTLTDQLATYAAYHRDRRNIALHFVGIPLIVLAVEILLSHPAFAIGPIPTTPAMIVSAIVALYYLRLDLRLGLTMAALLALGAWFGAVVATQTRDIWLGTGITLFVIGWAIQFVGHIYEGRKPAFLDDVIGLIVGPLFVIAEAAFLLGLRPDLREALSADDQSRSPTMK